MKRWWQKTPADLLVALFSREKTRWLAVAIFIAGTLFANWAAFSGAFSGEVLSRLGRPVNAQQQPVMYTFWLSWRTLVAASLDAVLVWALISVWREKKIRANKPRTETSEKSPFFRSERGGQLRSSTGVRQTDSGSAMNTKAVAPPRTAGNQSP